MRFLKKDIFKGKIKKEYFSYILVYMIFFVLLFVGVGALCVYASICGMTTNSYGERLLIASFGVIAFVLAGVYATRKPALPCWHAPSRCIPTTW